jgi:signal peptidase I
MVTMLSSKIKKYPRFISARVCGISMYPSIKSGERIIYAHVPPAKIHLGDIIVFQLNHKLICHRLIFKLRIFHKNILLEKGDNPFFPFSRIHQKKIIGKMINPPRLKKSVLLLTVPGIIIGYVAYLTKKLLFGNKSLGIITTLTKRSTANEPIDE